MPHSLRSGYLKSDTLSKRYLSRAEGVRPELRSSVASPPNTTPAPFQISIFCYLSLSISPVILKLVNYIFDFDGTLVDSMEAFIDIFNKNVRGKNNPLTLAEIDKYRGMSSRKAIRKMGIHWWQFPKILAEGVPEYHAKLASLKPFPNLSEVLKKLIERGDRLYIVTSNVHSSVETFIENNGLGAFFLGIETGYGLFKKGKAIKRLMKKYDLQRRDTVYIGDETRDQRAARQARVKIASVTWGFNDKEILTHRHPDYLLENPRDLLKISGN